MSENNIHFVHKYVYRYKFKVFDILLTFEGEKLKSSLSYDKVPSSRNTN